MTLPRALRPAKTCSGSVTRISRARNAIADTSPDTGMEPNSRETTMNRRLLPVLSAAMPMMRISPKKTIPSRVTS
jgi:hypothetical protein